MILCVACYNIYAVNLEPGFSNNTAQSIEEHMQHPDRLLLFCQGTGRLAGRRELSYGLETLLNLVTFEKSLETPVNCSLVLCALRRVQECLIECCQNACSHVRYEENLSSSDLTFPPRSLLRTV
jgi:hypothetical protein